MKPTTDFLHGTLDMLVLRVLSAGDSHGWAIAQRIRQVSNDALVLGEGTLYPALFRLEDEGWVESEWGLSDKGRKAKIYRLTKAGRKQLEIEKEGWERCCLAIEQVMKLA